MRDRTMICGLLALSILPAGAEAAATACPPAAFEGATLSPARQDVLDRLCAEVRGALPAAAGARLELLALSPSGMTVRLVLHRNGQDVAGDALTLDTMDSDRPGDPVLQRLAQLLIASVQPPAP